MHEARPRGYQRPLTPSAAARPFEAPLDDWLGDISDDDWSENVTGRAELRRVTPANGELSTAEGDSSRDPAPDRRAPARVATAEAHRAAVERRRTVAGLVVVVLLGAAAAIAVLVVRDGGQATVTPVAEPATTTTTTPASEETSPAPTTTTPSTSTTPTTPPVTTPAAFTLPEGTKLQRGEGDPSVVRELQQALSSAGYDPGPADGTFGHRTEAAVVAFQEANGLSVDGRVGPETAAALNRALADD